VLGLGNCEEIAAGVARGVIASFAGLDLELEGDRRTCQRILRVAPPGAVSHPGSTSSFAPEPGKCSGGLSHVSSPKFSQGCLVHVQPRTSAPPTLPGVLTWQWTADRGTLATRFVHAQLEAVAGRVVARAWLDDDARAPHDLLNGLAVMLTHRLGGGVFHAASVEVQGRVVVFIGPSGAGKSTACLHMDLAPIFSIDRLAILPLDVPRDAHARAERPDPDGTSAAQGTRPAPARKPLRERDRWFAHPLPGGTRPFTHTPFSRPRWLPISCILGSQKSAEGTSIVTPSRAGAVTLLRESTFQAGLAPSAERELLAALDDLAACVPVGRLRWTLGASLMAVSSRWLLGQAEERS
jgi:hypothetical protein